MWVCLLPVPATEYPCGGAAPPRKDLMMTGTARLKRPAWWIVAILAGFVAFSVINAARALRDPEEVEPLTVGQTVGLAFLQPVDSPTPHLFARANPGARQA